MGSLSLSFSLFFYDQRLVLLRLTSFFNCITVMFDYKEMK